jgi:hypothetical protein
MTTDLRQRVRWQYQDGTLTLDVTTAVPSALDRIRMATAHEEGVLEALRPVVLAVHRIAREGVGEATDADFDTLLGSLSDTELGTVLRRIYAGGSVPGEERPG